MFTVFIIAMVFITVKVKLQRKERVTTTTIIIIVVVVVTNYFNLRMR